MTTETVAERKAKYEESALKQLMEASGHQICERCYCCDVVSERDPCWLCGGFEPEEEFDGFPPDVCVECDGEGRISSRHCIGNCDENGNHVQKVFG